MLMGRTTAAVRARSSIFESFRVEAVTVLVLAVAVPWMLFSRPIISVNPNAATLVGRFDNVILGSIFAGILGLFLLRRVIAFPGSRVFSYIVPSFLTSYGLVVVAFLLLRLDYSRGFLITSFALASATSYAIRFYHRRRRVDPLDGTTYSAGARRRDRRRPALRP